MTRDARFDVLFEPVDIGPVTAPNRFYQVPHCTGMGYRRPHSVAALRGIKAEGGWGTVNTEYCSIHPTTDDEPYPTASMWDDHDVAAMAITADKIHDHGALAGIELWHGGSAAANLYSRETPLGPVGRPAGYQDDPIQSRAMDKSDIAELKRLHREAARRAQRAGFDIVYVYANHHYLIHQFLSASNDRPDEYGGSLENRARLLKELIIDTKEEVGDTCAIAVRFSASTGGTDDDQETDEPREVLALLSDLPDLWDITVDDYTLEMGTSRFVPEAALEETMSWVKSVTDKPVVSVGRFTSPETMLRLVRQGVVDLVGAARPSIADPFLPTKIAEGREDEIRECIGCNVCYVGDQTGTPIRCTQNPAIGEEWRKGWHPESIPPKSSDLSVLIVGGGPAGLEAAVSLGKRGYDVILTEARRELGGRVALESRLPGLAEWRRVADWRLTMIDKLKNVEFYLDSTIDEDQILEFDPDQVALATGAKWRRDGVGRWLTDPVKGWDGAHVFSPDDLMSGATPVGPVVVYDDDHYYLGGVIAEKLRQEDLEVTLVTPANEVSSWTRRTDEQFRIQRRMLQLDISVETGVTLSAVEPDHVILESVHTEQERQIAARSVVMVTSRVPNDQLFETLKDRVAVERIGDCLAPGTIETAVYSGHRYAQELEQPAGVEVSFLRDSRRVTS